MDYRENIQKYLTREIEVIKSLNADEINDAVNAIREAAERSATIWVMGNGGSAATASHMVCDLSKGVYSTKSGSRYDVRCLSDNTPTFSAIANDIGYDNVFEFQLHGLLKKNDLVIAISGSGNSENIIKATEYAKEIGAPLLGITGYDGGRLRNIADYRLHVPVDDMQMSEDIHMIFDHMIMRVLCETK